MNFKTFTTLATLTAALTTTVAPTQAGYVNHMAYNVGMEHNQLISAIRSTGIQFKVNPVECDKDDAPMGYYWAAKNEMVICQDNRRTGFGFQHEVRWTANDLDTLRHEAQHLVQDCMSGHYRDGHLGAVYQDPIGLAKDILPTSYIKGILESYSDVDEHTLVMELEAFSVAAMNDPIEQVRDVQKYCF
tara:strand:+ start:73 stop:636 length:564 start_codon:yes stop_codon:yes gene_type:complete